MNIYELYVGIFAHFKDFNALKCNYILPTIKIVLRLCKRFKVATILLFFRDIQ